MFCLFNCKKQIEITNPVIINSIDGKWTYLESKGSGESNFGALFDYNKKAMGNHFLEIKNNGNFYTNGDGIDRDICPLSEEIDGNYSVDNLSSTIRFIYKAPNNMPDRVQIVKFNLIDSNKLSLEIGKSIFLKSMKESKFDDASIDLMESLYKNFTVTTYLIK